MTNSQTGLLRDLSFVEGDLLDTLAEAAAAPEIASRLQAKLVEGYGRSELLAWPSLARPKLCEETRPLAGRPTHGWGDQALDSPKVESRAAHRLHAAWRRREGSPIDDVERLFATTDFGPSLHSPFVVLDEAGARASAGESARRYQRGQSLGPLDGILVALKDEADQRGLPTAGGCPGPFRPASRDGFLASKLREAGAILPGKTHATEWGMDAIGRNVHYRMPRNPHGTERAAGGSSTGSAVAVALGLLPLASASDGGGSARIPAALCGVFGLKPTFGTIGRSGSIFGGGTLHAIGAIGSCSEDLVDFLAIVASRPDPNDGQTLWSPDRKALGAARRQALGRGVRGCRVGLLREYWDSTPPDLSAPALAALRALEREGAVLSDLSLPLAQMAHPTGFLTIATETSAGLADQLRSHPARMSAALRLLLRLGGATPVAEYARAVRCRASLRHQVARLFHQVDVVALPATRIPAPGHPASQDGRSIFADAEARGLCAFTFLANLTGLPAASAPVGQTNEGMPAALQIVGDAWDEASVLAVLAHLERIAFAG
jgi:aspartyl-tRNA(Asn)/glutamyl-tRNA(Gln) amidotransferase subunit A